MNATGSLGANLTSSQIASHYQARALRVGLDVVEQEGAQAIQLIEAASIDPDVGQGLDLRI